MCFNLNDSYRKTTAGRHSSAWTNIPHESYIQTRKKRRVAEKKKKYEIKVCKLIEAPPDLISCPGKFLSRGIDTPARPTSPLEKHSRVAATKLR